MWMGCGGVGSGIERGRGAGGGGGGGGDATQGMSFCPWTSVVVPASLYTQPQQRTSRVRHRLSKGLRTKSTITCRVSHVSMET